MSVFRRVAYCLFSILIGGPAMTTNAAEPHTFAQPITQTFADDFAREWVDAWNSHDIERILSHYSDDFEMASPLIAQRGFSATGSLQGKEAVRAYWTPAVGPGSTLQFELIQALVSVDSIAIHYRSGSRLCVEVVRFNAQGRVTAGAAHYYPAIE